MGQPDDLVDDVDYLDLRTHIEPHVIRRVESRIPGLSVEVAQGAIPFQSEGTLAGLPYYFKYKSGYARLRVGGDLSAAPLYEADQEYGHPLDGALDDDEFAHLFPRLVRGLRRAPRLWEFTGVVVHATPRGPAVGTPTTYGAWGETPEEAFAAMHQYPQDSAYTKHVTPKEHQAALMARDMNPSTITVDERVWPDPQPRFVVLSRWNPRYWGRRLLRR
jgi:hypothetical protein